MPSITPNQKPRSAKSSRANAYAATEQDATFATTVTSETVSELVR